MVRWGSKFGGSNPRTRRVPPRLGCPASAPHSAGGWARGQADKITPAARPACSTSRRLKRGTDRRGEYCVSMDIPPLASPRQLTCAGERRDEPGLTLHVLGLRTVPRETAARHRRMALHTGMYYGCLASLAGCAEKQER